MVLVSVGVLRRSIFLWSCALFMAFVLAYGFDPSAKFLGTVSGVVVSASPPSRVNDGYLDIRVRLPAGAVVLAKGPIVHKHSYQINSEVCLGIYQTLIFRQHRYLVTHC